MARRPAYDRGAWLTQRQRLRLTDPQPPPPDRGSWIKDLLPPLLRRLHLEGELWQNRIGEQWPAIVGPQVAAHARPGPVERGLLTVYVVHSVWLQELQRAGLPRMLANLKQVLPDAPVRRIRLLVDPEAGSAGPGRARRGGTGGAPC